MWFWFFHFHCSLFPLECLEKRGNSQFAWSTSDHPWPTRLSNRRWRKDPRWRGQRLSNLPSGSAHTMRSKSRSFPLVIWAWLRSLWVIFRRSTSIYIYTSTHTYIYICIHINNTYIKSNTSVNTCFHLHWNRNIIFMLHKVFTYIFICHKKIYIYIIYTYIYTRHI